MRGITVRRGGRTVLTDVSFSAAAGQVTAVLGGPGAGKTVLLSAIAGLIAPERGAVMFDGLDISALKPSRRGVAFLPPGSALPANRSVEACLHLLAGRGGAAAADARIEALGLARVRGQAVGLLSHGEALLALQAARLGGGGGICLVDEAGAGLDAASAERLHGLLREAASAGRVVLIATRDRRMARLADQLVLLAEGGLLQAGTPASLYAEPACAAAARLTGEANILRGHVRELRPGGFVWAGSGRYVQASGAEMRRPVLGSAVTLCLRPERLVLLDEGEAADNRLEAVIEEVRSAGPLLRVRAQTVLGPMLLAVPAWGREPAPAAGQRRAIGWGAGAATLLSG